MSKGKIVITVSDEDGIGGEVVVPQNYNHNEGKQIVDAITELLSKMGYDV